MTAMVANRAAAEKMEALAQRAERAESRHSRALGRAKHERHVYYGAAASSGAGLLLGYIKGRYDTTEVKGVPIALAVGIASHAAGFYTTGVESHVLHAAGDAALAISAFNFGETLGDDRQAKTQQQQQAA